MFLVPYSIHHIPWADIYSFQRAVGIAAIFSCVITLTLQAIIISTALGTRHLAITRKHPALWSFPVVGAALFVDYLILVSYSVMNLAGHLAAR